MLFLFCSLQWRIQGRGPGNPVPPPLTPILRPNWGPKVRKKIFRDRACPLSQGLDDRPPSSPPYPKVWIHRDATTAGFWFPLEMTFEEELQKFYSDNVTSQIKVVLLTGRAAIDLCYPDLGSDTSSVWLYGSFAVVPQTSFRGETISGVE